MRWQRVSKFQFQHTMCVPSTIDYGSTHLEPRKNQLCRTLQCRNFIVDFVEVMIIFLFCVLIFYEHEIVHKSLTNWWQAFSIPNLKMQLTESNMQPNIIFPIRFAIVRRSDITIWLLLEIKHLPVSNIFYVGYGSSDVCHLRVSASHLHTPPVLACICSPYTPRIHLFFTKIWSNLS